MIAPIVWQLLLLLLSTLLQWWLLNQKQTISHSLRVFTHAMHHRTVVQRCCSHTALRGKEHTIRCREYQSTALKKVEIQGVGRWWELIVLWGRQAVAWGWQNKDCWQRWFEGSEFQSPSYSLSLFKATCRIRSEWSRWKSIGLEIKQEKGRLELLFK